jgi:cytochrome P450
VFDSKTDIATAFCPFDQATQDDYAAMLERARAERIFYSSYLSAWVIARYGDIDGVLRDPATFSSKGVLPMPTEPEIREAIAGVVAPEGTLIGWDPPDHTRLRSALARAFTPKRAASLEPTIRELCDQLIGEMAGGKPFDLHVAFSRRLPVSVVFALIGIPPDRWDFCQAGSNDMIALQTADVASLDGRRKRAVIESTLEFHRYIAGLIEQRRVEPKDDLISAVWAARRESQIELSDYEMLSLFPGLIFAGHETTAILISNSVHMLLSDRRRWQSVVESGAVSREAIEEFLRFEAPISGFSRTVTADAEVAGRRLKAGDRVFLLYSAGNHDPERFADPDDLDLERRPQSTHLAFGRGPHFCIGAPLARLEAKVAIERLAVRLPGLQLADPGPRWRPDYNLRHLDQLTVSFAKNEQRSTDYHGDQATPHRRRPDEPPGPTAQDRP